MTELSLRGLDEDESALVLEDPTGAQYRLTVDDTLIASVRGAHRRQAASARSGEPLRPRDIQAMIRQGMTAEEVSAETGEDLAHIRLYERPVLAERQHIAQQAGRVLVCPDTDTGSPTPLADLALQRLKLREVDPESTSWDAWRRADGNWQIELAFEAGARMRTAGWSYSRGSVSALDDEARWLSDAGPTDSGPIPDYGSGEERKQRAQTSPPPGRDHQSETGRILESLRRRRGVSQSQQNGEAAHPDEIPDETAPPQAGAGGLRLVGDAQDRTIDGAHSAPSAPHEAGDASIVALPAQEDAGTAEKGRHPDQHTAPIGTPDFESPEFAGSVPAAPDPTTQDASGFPQGGEAAGDDAGGPGENHPSLLDDPALTGWGGSADGSGLLADSGPQGRETADDAEDRGQNGDSAHRRRGRASVPSWDEIMFGGRSKD